MVSRRYDAHVGVVSHVFHRAHAAGTLSIMPPHPAIRRLGFLTILVLVVSTTACRGGGAGREGTIRIIVTRGKGLGVDHCKGSVNPNEILKMITVREEDGSEVARMTVRRRDAVVKTAGVDGRRCVVKATMDVEAPVGAPYEITADDETVTVTWPSEGIDDCYFGDCIGYPVGTVPVPFFARGGPQSAEIRALMNLGLSCDILRDLHHEDTDEAPYDASTKEFLARPESAEVLPLVEQGLSCRFLKQIQGVLKA